MKTTLEDLKKQFLSISSDYKQALTQDEAQLAIELDTSTTSLIYNLQQNTNNDYENNCNSIYFYIKARDYLNWIPWGKTTTSVTIWEKCSNCENPLKQSIYYKCDKCNNFYLCEWCMSDLMYLHSTNHNIVISPEIKRPSSAAVDKTYNVELQLEEGTADYYVYEFGTNEELKLPWTVKNWGQKKLPRSRIIFRERSQVKNDSCITVKQIEPSSSIVLDPLKINIAKLEIGIHLLVIQLKNAESLKYYGNELEVKIKITKKA